MLILPGMVVQGFKLAESPYADMIFLGVIIAVLIVIVIAFGEKKVFAFSLNSFGKTFVVGGVMTAVTAYYLITNIYKAVK